MTMDQDEGNDQGAVLSEPGGKLRLYVEAALATGVAVVPPPDQTHYLLRVMRAGEGDSVLLFNGHDGEWVARVSLRSRRDCALLVQSRVAPQAEVPDLWLAFAPVKRTPADYITQKATELGVRRLQPVITHRTIARRVNGARMRANAIEAAEQSGRLSVPAIGEPQDLGTLLKGWPNERPLVFCDESGEASPISAALAGARKGVAWGILTGPEGGFDDGERAQICGHPFVIPVSLGPRIMRADTAALSALAIWQSVCGDWQ